MKDLYAVLGIDMNASANDIREAYRKLSKKFHPDLNENDVYFENRFKEIREAYELLIDPVGKAAYDGQLKKFRSYPSTLSAEPKRLQKGSVNAKINWAFTAVLLVVTGLFAYYVVRMVSPVKPTKVAAVSEATTTSPVVLHHKKHRHKKEPAVETVAVHNQGKLKVFSDTTSTTAVKPPVTKVLAPAVAMSVQKPVGPPAIQQSKPAPAQSTTVVSARPAQPNNAPVSPRPAPVTTAPNLPSANNQAYIKANATGVVYMRQMDNYNAEVVSTIPGDTRITVLEKSGNFYKISYNNKTGYIPNWTVQFR